MKEFYLGCLVFLCTACSQTQNEKSGEVPMKVICSPVTAITSDVPSCFSFIAKSFRESDLSFRVSGPIKQFDVHSGNFYKKGDVIARIDPRDFVIREERCRAMYDLAKVEFERIEKLYNKNNVSQSAYEKSKTEYITSKMAYETAKNELNDTKLVAPFDGYIGDVFFEKFQEVRASQPVFSFVDVDKLKIEAYVSLPVASNAKNLQTAKIVFDDSLSTEYEVTILEVSKSTTSNNISYLLTAVLNNKDKTLLPGMSGKIHLPQPKKNIAEVLVVPQKALCHRPSEGDYVWVVNADTQQVNRRKVTVGELKQNGYMVIRDGVKAGELVAVSGLRFLSENKIVTVE